MRKDICRWVWGKESGFWKEALAHHYAHNPHHPQNRIGPMEEHDLEESVVDMMACSWERREGGREDVSAEALADVSEVTIISENVWEVRIVMKINC